MPNSFHLNDMEYFKQGGVDVMAFSDVYPEGHQSGVTVIMNDMRIAANGDVRFEQTPGQWQPISRMIERRVLKDQDKIEADLAYPNMKAHLHGFNPMIYPDFSFQYTVSVQAVTDGVQVKVDLDRPIDPRYAGKLCFNLELYPG